MYGGARAAVRIGLTARCRSVAKEPDDPRALHLRCVGRGRAGGSNRGRAESLSQADRPPVGGDLFCGPEAGGKELLEDAVHDLFACGSEWRFPGQPGWAHDQTHSGRGIEAGTGRHVGIGVGAPFEESLEAGIDALAIDAVEVDPDLTVAAPRHGAKRGSCQAELGSNEATGRSVGHCA